MFNAISEYTLFIFAACNILTLPMVWALYPESNQRTLEEMNLLFACDSIWNWEAERNFAILKEENPQLVRAASRGQSMSVDPEMQARRRSQGIPSLSAGDRRASEADTVVAEKGAVDKS